MKRNLLVLITLLFSTTIFAQSYNGYRSSNYNGVNGVFFNPANIADNNYRWDFNLFSLNAGVLNNSASFNFRDITKISDANDGIDSILFDGNKNNFSALGNIDILGPSLMFSVNKKLSFAVTSRFRALTNIQDIDTKLIRSISSNTGDIDFPYIIASNKNQKITANAFGDIGLSAGMVLSNSKEHFFKAGVSVKYLSGVSNGFINIDNVNGTIDEDVLPPNDVFITNASGRIAIGQGGLDINSIESNVFRFKSSGVGADIGFIYEHRPDYGNKIDDDNKYKFKAGLSVLDLGSIRYQKSDDQFHADYNMNIPAQNKLYLKDFDDKDFSEIKTYLDNSPFFTNNSTNNNSYTVSLPTVLQANFDYNILKNFYTDVSAQFSLNSKTTNTNSFHPTSITVTPRYENKFFGAYLPLNYNDISNFNAGVALRAGPLYVGSGSVLTALVGDSKQADFYFGLRFGGLRKQKKPVKEVTIIEETVTTETVEEIKETPKVPDSDNDGINDNDDKCPYVFGIKKYDGCPVPDTDKDGINDEDDKCVTTPGLLKYNGCPVPDKDNDGINDEEDRCPEVAGVRENFGCPEIKKDVIKKVNYAAAHLLFATGKSTILPASYTSLNLVVAILETDNTLKLQIDGHTDNVGKPDKNQVLSEARANAAKAYLVKKGIDADRILTTGYGDTKPIADNKNAAGKKKNRRIEMKVFN